MRNFTGNGNVILDLFLEMFEKLGSKRVMTWLF